MTTEKTAEDKAVDILLQEAGEKGIAGLIHKADDKYPADMTFQSTHGYVTIYDTKTGDSSLINRYMLGTCLKKKREDGSRVFWTEPPKDLPPRPAGLNCLLHPDNPDRVEYDKLGLPTCPRVRLANPFEVTRHMRVRHKMAWEAIQEENRRKEKEEERREKEADRKFQRELLGKTKEK